MWRSIGILIVTPVCSIVATSEFKVYSGPPCSFLNIVYTLLTPSKIEVTVNDSLMPKGDLQPNPLQPSVSFDSSLVLSNNTVNTVPMAVCEIPTPVSLNSRYGSKELGRCTSHGMCPLPAILIESDRLEYSSRITASATSLYRLLPVIISKAFTLALI